VNGSATAVDALNGTGTCGSSTVAASNALPGVNAGTAHAQGRCGYGPRLPLLAISPWTKSNYIDSTITDQSSIPRFIEDVFLASQRIGGGSFDSIAGTLDNMFDFSQSSPQNGAVILVDNTTGEVTSGASAARDATKSASLRARAREMRDHGAENLAEVLAAAIGKPTPDAEARLIALHLVAAWQAALQEGIRLHREGASTTKTRNTVQRLLNRGLEAVSAAAAATPYERRH